MMLSTEARKFLLDMSLFLTEKGVKESDVESFLEDAKLYDSRRNLHRNSNYKRVL